ncbi:MAG TPA: sigma 54-interacting transcriptional regulator [Vicinamibacterales bacterium]
MALGRPCRAQLVVSADSFPEIDGSSAAIRALKRDMLCVARDPDVTALIVGESGTGKERIAQAIHRASPRAARPFVVVDCAGLSATLAEDTLFGHVRGAFTGAIDERAGPFERADGGTVLLDEIGDLPLELQMKLLRAVQSRTIQRLGARQDTAFDVRIIAATHVDLAAAVARGRFREDLSYRLRVYEIGVPPLRRRGADDICALAAAILERLARHRRRVAPAIAPEVVEWLIGHPWPGNVRELENVLERMLVAACGEPVLHARHLPAGPSGSRAASPPLRASPPTAARIVEALQRPGIRVGRAAADLGLSRHQLYRLVRRYGIRVRSSDP